MTALHTFLTTPFLGTSTWLWLVFMAIVIGLLVLDLGVLHRHDREIEMRESLLLYSGYFSVGVLFGVGVWYQLGAQSALEFYTGFLVEQSLSMDNVFVMAMIFSYFAIPAATSTACCSGASSGGVPAGDHDRRGRGAGAELRLGTVYLRCLPAVYRGEDGAVEGR